MIFASLLVATSAWLAQSITSDGTHVVVATNAPLYVAPDVDAAHIFPSDGSALNFGDRGPRGFVARVVKPSDDWTLIETDDAGCASDFRLRDVRLKLYVRNVHLLLTVARPTTIEDGDGTTITVLPGAPIAPLDDKHAVLHVSGAGRVRVALERKSLVKSFEPVKPAPFEIDSKAVLRADSFAKGQNIVVLKSADKSVEDTTISDVRELRREGTTKLAEFAFACSRIVAWVSHEVPAAVMGISVTNDNGWRVEGRRELTFADGAPAGFTAADGARFADAPRELAAVGEQSLARSCFKRRFYHRPDKTLRDDMFLELCAATGDVKAPSPAALANTKSPFSRSRVGAVARAEKAMAAEASSTPKSTSSGSARASAPAGPGCLFPWWGRDAAARSTAATKPSSSRQSSSAPPQPSNPQPVAVPQPLPTTTRSGCSFDGQCQAGERCLREPYSTVGSCQRFEVVKPNGMPASGVNPKPSECRSDFDCGISGRCANVGGDLVCVAN